MIKIYKLSAVLLYLVIIINSYDIYESKEKYAILKVTSTESAKLFCRHHTVDYEIEISAIYQVNEKISSSISVLKNICQKVQFNHICLYVMNEIRSLSKLFFNRSRLIQNFQLYSRRRRVMNNFMSILQKTVLLTDNSYNDLKNGINEMQSLVNNLRKSQNKFLDEYDYTNFYSLAQLTELNLRNLLHITNAIVELFLNKNIEHITEVVPLQALKETFLRVNEDAKKDNCELPLEINNLEMIKILKMSKVLLTKTTKTLSIKLQIPTTSKQIYRITKSISLPFPSNNLSFEVQPITEEYLFVEKEVIFALPFSFYEKTKCSILKSDIFMCNPENAMQITNTRPLESFFLPEFEKCNEFNKSHMDDFSKYRINCNIKQSLHLNRIIPISSHEVYVYIVKPTPIHISCPTHNLNKYINSSIFIENLDIQCSVRVNDAYLADHSNKNSTNNKKQYNLLSSYAISDSDLIKKEPKIFTVKPLNEFQPDFTDLKNEIEATKNKKVEEIPEIPRESYWTEIILVAAVYLSIILGLMIADLYYRYKQPLLHHWSRVRNSCFTATDNV